jgi:hypothetical protein
MTNSIKAGDKLRIKVEWRDDRSDDTLYVAVDNEEKGRVTISPTALEGWFLPFMPREVVRVEMIERV